MSDPTLAKEIAGPLSVLRLYFKHTKTYKVSLFLVFVGMIGIQASDLAVPLFLRKFFNTLASGTPDATTIHALVITISIVAVLSLLTWVFRRIHGFSIMHLESNVMADLLNSAFGHLIGHSYNFFISRFAGSLTHRVSKFSRAYEALFDALIMQFFPTFIFVGGAIVVLFLRHHLLGIIFFIWTLLFVAFQVYVANTRRPLRTFRAEKDTLVTGALADSISNHPTIQLFSGIAHERNRFRDAVLQWNLANIKVWFTDEKIWAVMGMFMIVINIGLLYAAMRLWAVGLVTIGDFVLIQAYLISSFERLIAINRELRRFYDAFADAGEMAYLMRMPYEIADRAGAAELSVSRGEIVFRNVSFTFGGANEILNDFNLEIRGAEKIALVGPSGAGKSTITKLLLRLYDVKGGSIEIDGQNIAQVTQDSLHNAIAFVPQEPILFHRTLMENIRYGRRDATDAEVIEAATKAHCHEFISNLPLGYGTYVGERGVKLSGGERQRVAIARAILKNAPILLLDEATSSLDSESESLIQDALATLMEGKTVLVIAHRLSTIMRMDRIVVLDGGKISAMGTHQALLRKKGLYRKLWNIQAGGFIGEDTEGVALDDEEGSGREELADERSER